MKLKLAVLGGLLLAVLGSGVAALAQRGEAEPEQPVAAAKQPPPAAANQGAAAVELPVARIGSLSWRTGGHPISFLALLDDQVISAGRDGWVRVWDRATGKELRRFGDVADQTPYAGPFVVLSPDGQRLVVAAHESLERTRMIFDVATGKEVCRLPEGTTPRAFSADGRLLLAAGSKNALNMFDAASGKELYRLDLNSMPYMTMPIFTPDGRSLAAIVGGKHLQFWDAASGKPTRKLLIGNTSNTVGPPLFSFDGRAVLCMNGIIDLTTDKETPVPGQARSDTTYAIYSPDLKTAAVVNRDGPIQLHELTTGKRLHTLGGPLPHKGGYQNVAFSPTGKFLVTGDGGTGRATVWNVQTGAPTLPEESTRDVRIISFGRNDDTMAGAGYGSMIRLWDSGTGKPLAVANSTGHDGAIISLDLSADGKTLRTLGDRTVRQWDLASGKETACFELGASGQAKSVHTVAGRTVVCGIGPAPFGNAGPILTLLDVTTGKNLIELDVAGGPNVSLSPDGKYVILQLRNLYRVHEAATGKEVFKLEDPVEAALGGIPVQPGGAMAFAPDGDTVATLVILSTNQRLSDERRPGSRPERPVARIEGTFVNLWSLRTGKKLRELKVPGVGITEAVFTPDGRSLVLAAGQFAVAVNENRNPEAMPTNAPLFLWEVAGGGLRRPLALQQRPELFAVSPDSRLLAAVAARDPAIRLFSLITGGEVGQRSGHLGPVRCLAFTPDSRRLISGSEDTTALVHDVAGLGTMVRTELSRGDVERLWGDLADRSSSKASNALAALLGNGARTVSYLKEHVKPVAQPDAKELARLLAALDAEQFEEREQAAAKLEALGELALDPLQKRLAGKPSLEVSRRIERILTAIETQPAPAATLRTLRAIEILELLGTPDAQLVIDKLAQGAAGARITVEAQAARQRLARRQR